MQYAIFNKTTIQKRKERLEQKTMRKWKVFKLPKRIVSNDLHAKHNYNLPEHKSNLHGDGVANTANTSTIGADWRKDVTAT